MNISDKFNTFQFDDLKRAVYNSDLTTTQLNILRYAASEIKKKPSCFPRVSFNAKEFLKAGGLDDKESFDNIEEIADELTRKRIMIHHENEFNWYLWLQSLVFDNGILHLEFNPIIKQMIIECDF